MPALSVKPSLASPSCCLFPPPSLGNAYASACLACVSSASDLCKSSRLSSGVSRSPRLGCSIQPRVIQAAKNFGLLIGSPAPAHCGQPDCLILHQAPFDWCGPLTLKISPPFLRWALQASKRACLRTILR